MLGTFWENFNPRIKRANSARVRTNMRSLGLGYNQGQCQKRRSVHLVTTCTSGILACFILDKPWDDIYTLTAIGNEIASGSQVGTHIRYGQEVFETSCFEDSLNVPDVRVLIIASCG
jgi:hypothetical protein